MNTKSGWQLSGDGPNAYEKYIVPAYTGAWASEIVNRACLGKDEKILDVACGTGLAARVAGNEVSHNEALPAASGRGIGLNTAPQGAGY